MEESPFKSFSTLPQEKRRQLLTELASHFRPSDWWHLDRLLQQQNIYHRFDIIAALPIELALQVLQYLPLQDLFLNRRVSRCWHNILSSDAICEGLALERFPDTSREFILSQQSEHHRNTKSWRHFFEDIASQRYFFSKGKYIAYPQLDSLLPKLSECATHPRLCLYEENLATWGSRLTYTNYREVVVCNLQDPAQMMHFPIPSREVVDTYAINGELLAVLTCMGRCHAFRMDTGQRKTMLLESGAYKALLAVTSTIAIIYSTNIIIWETNTGMSFRVETSLTEPRVWAYDLDPVGHVISRIYLDEAACVVWQEQFQYGVKVEECHPRSWVLKRVPEHSYTAVGPAGIIYGYNNDSSHKGIHVLHNLRKRHWGRPLMWLMPDGKKAMPSLAYDHRKGEWKVRENTIPPEALNNLGRRYYCKNGAYALEDATVFWPGTSGTSGIDIYLWDEERWVKWVGEWQNIPYTDVKDMSLRHIVVMGRNELDEVAMEVRRFMGIHERKALEERYRGKVEDAYGTLLNRSRYRSWI